MVSWKSADASMAGLTWDDYIAAQIDAIDVVRARLDVPSVHAVGYCVAGTTLAHAVDGPIMTAALPGETASRLQIQSPAEAQNAHLARLQFMEEKAA